MQPWIKSEAVAGAEMFRQPAFRWGIGERLDAPGPAIDLFRRLQRIAPIDEYRRLMRQHDRLSSRSGEAGEPGQPFFRWRHIFVLLLICAGNHESAQIPPHQFLAKRGQPRGQRHAAFGLLECLENGFEHAWPL